MLVIDQKPAIQTKHHSFLVYHSTPAYAFFYQSTGSTAKAYLFDTMEYLRL